MPHTGRDVRVPVRFDEDAVRIDLTYQSDGAAEALRAFRAEIERQGGLLKSQILNCTDEARDGTSLPGFFKAYVGDWGLVFDSGLDLDGSPCLFYFAYGVRHQPDDSNALTVYEIADLKRRQRDQ